MTMRALRLPGDLLPLADMLVETFQYPENPEWSVQADEEEDISREIRSLRRLWPLIRVAQAVSKPMRDLFRGFVWEENGRLGAVVIAQRQSSTNMWTIGTVGVLPEFRRRGLARQLLTRTLDDIRSRGGTHVVLAVIDRNVPAYSLYTSLGFTHYSSQVEYHRIPEQADSPTASMPAQYTQRDLGRFDWQPRYALAQRITPESIAEYEPVTPDRYRAQRAIRLLVPVLDRMQKRVNKNTSVFLSETILARGGYRTTKTNKGTSVVWAEMDPEHPDLAVPLLSGLTGSVAAISPALRIQFSGQTWMPALCEAANTLGFEKRLEYHWLGLTI